MARATTTTQKNGKSRFNGDYRRFAKNVIENGLTTPPETTIRKNWKIAPPTDTPLLTPSDAALIEKFSNARKAEQDLSDGGVLNIRSVLAGWRRFLPEFSTLTYDDITDGVNAAKDAGFSDATRRNMVVHLKTFLVWCARRGAVSIPIDEIKAIGLPKKSDTSITAKDILTEEEIRAMIDAAPSIRDKAMVALLYETGARINEIATLTWGQVEFTKTGASVRVRSKTDKERHVPVFASREHLARWKSVYEFPHPLDEQGKPKDVREAWDSLPVFTTKTGESFTYQGIAERLSFIARKAGINRKINPHLLRHTRITHLLRQGVSEASIKFMMWGSISTGMLKIYAHLTGQDAGRELQKLHGIENPEEEKNNPLEPIQCSECHTVLPPGTDFCPSCTAPLSDQAKMDVSKAESEATQRLIKILRNPVKAAKFAQFVTELAEEEAQNNA